MFRCFIALMSLCGGTAVAEAFNENFADLDSARWSVANYDFAHPAFDTDWKSEQVEIDQGLTLHLSPHSGSNPGSNRFAGASIRTEGKHHFGRYEARMRAGQGAGVVTGFFTYTGPHYHTRHDEIDIEFLGKDTTQMHVAMFVDGVHTNKFISLEFDAAECMHEYAFEWWPDKVIWFVNGRQVFEHSVHDRQLPTVPGHLIANIWAADPSIANWSGFAAANTRTAAHVEAIRFSPFNLNHSGS